MAQQRSQSSIILERLAHLERYYDGPIPDRLRRWALGATVATSPYLNKPLRSLAEVERSQSRQRAAE